MLTLDRLRAHARLATLFAPTTLAGAVGKLGFVQADPIRAPARAQDLILRHRVTGYRAGDLERSFVRLKLEEHFLYAYGFMPSETWHLIHPRHDPHGKTVPHAADGLATDGLAAEVLAFVRANGPTHPGDLEKRFGRDRAVNGWGGFSKATTEALHHLHRDGLLRVAKRRDGIRVYEIAPSAIPAADHAHATDHADRTHRVTMLVAAILAPAPLASLRSTLAMVARRNTRLGPLAPALAAALKSGELERDEIDGETYVWPARDGALQQRRAPRDVRLLAPFDPIVWDRRRFEHLWGWPYRFEAYVPVAKRSLGYYAMPLLWGADVIGWANVTFASGKLDADIGYVGKPPRSRAYRAALDAELARMERFLTPRRTARREPRLDDPAPTSA